MKFTRPLLICIAALVLPSTVYAQLGDGECTSPLNLPAETIQLLNGILEETVSGTEVASHGVSAPLTSVSPVADGMISAGEYPNMCHYSFADRENPGNPFPSLDSIEEVEGSEENDLNLNFYLGHTDTFLFLGFEAQDEFLDLDEGTEAFRNDSVELFLNPDLEIDDFNPDTVGRNSSGEGMQLVADAAGEGDIELNNRFSAGAVPQPNLEPVPPPGPDEFYTAGLPTDTGWVVEWQIPLASLDTDSDDNVEVVPATTGDVMLMNFAINDNDFEGATGQDTHAMQWVVEDDPRSPFGGGENVWVVPLELSGPVGPIGDLDGDGDCDADDIDALSAAIRNGDQGSQFDLDGSGSVDAADRKFLICDIKGAYLGDSNLDGEFNSSDFVAVFQIGEYEDAVASNSGWADGDWNGDGDFDSSDFVVAFQEGGYETGPKVPPAAAVPEPATAAMAAIALTALFWFRRQQRS